MNKHVKESYKILDSLRLDHGLYLASPSDDYSYVWLRDSVYMSMPYLDKKDGYYEKAYWRMLDLFLSLEDKITIHTAQRPVHIWEYIHAKYDADSVTEIHHQEWGHAQHDAVGAFLFGIAQGFEEGKAMFRGPDDFRIVQKLVDYLGCCRYWEDPDNGMWEEWREVHASSVGACVAGLEAIKRVNRRLLGWEFKVPQEWIEFGVTALYRLLPRESVDKKIDLAMLSLVYPYRVKGLGYNHFADIVRSVEEQLLRSHGVIRYEGDSYYSLGEMIAGRDMPREYYKGGEAEWTFGLPWLALCYMEMGDMAKAKHYIKLTESIMLEGSALPELYYSGADGNYNGNTPLGWSNALYIVAKERYKELK
jgi:phosphorylase kinase alpha/beta subunit